MEAKKTDWVIRLLSSILKKCHPLRDDTVEYLSRSCHTIYNLLFSRLLRYRISTEIEYG